MIIEVLKNSLFFFKMLMRHREFMCVKNIEFNSIVRVKERERERQEGGHYFCDALLLIEERTFTLSRDRF